MGSFFFLLEKKDGSPIIVAGPCWPFCTFVTVPLILVLSTLVMVFIVFNKDSGMVSSELSFVSIILSSTSYNTKISIKNTITTGSLGGLH